MNEKSSRSTQPPAPRRGAFLVDRELQFAVTIHLIGVLLGIAGLYTLATFVLPSGGLKGQTSEEAWGFLVRNNLIYLVLSIVLLGTVSLLLTHRVAGPVLVIERAIQGMQQGDYERRLTLRKRDYLKGLAASVAQLAAHMRQQEAQRLEVLREIDGCLEENDLPAARELLHRLGLPEQAPAAAPEASRAK
ncbi:MAG: hypothetical protein ACT4PV_05465 [Planctomycetaceae bacterium]